MSGTQYLAFIVAIPGLAMVLAGGYWLADSRLDDAHVREETVAAGIAIVTLGLMLLSLPLTAFGYLN